jgi:hypothetical protein
MKRIYAVIIFIGFLHNTYAGGFHGGHYSTTIAEKKFNFSFNFGLALPLGDFANKTALPQNDSTHAHGFASTGFHFEIGVGYLFSKNVGIAGCLGGSVCAFDAAAYSAVYNVPPTFSVSASGKHYVAQYLIGPYFFFPLSDNFGLEAKIMAGIITSRYPDVTIASNMPGNFQAQMYSYTLGSGFGYAFSFGGRLKVGDLMNVLATVSYIGSTVNYPGQLETASTPSGYGYTYLSLATRSMSLGVVALTVGFGVSF